MFSWSWKNFTIIDHPCVRFLGLLKHSFKNEIQVNSRGAVLHRQNGFKIFQIYLEDLVIYPAFVTATPTARTPWGDVDTRGLLNLFCVVPSSSLLLLEFFPPLPDFLCPLYKRKVYLQTPRGMDFVMSTRIKKELREESFGFSGAFMIYENKKKKEKEKKEKEKKERAKVYFELAFPCSQIVRVLSELKKLYFM